VGPASAVSATHWNVACTYSGEFIVIEQVALLPLQLPPDHPEKLPPLFGAAVRVTTVPLLNVAPQVAPESELQFMPAGLLVIVPPPDAATDNCAGSCQLAGGV